MRPKTMMEAVVTTMQIDIINDAINDGYLVTKVCMSSFGGEVVVVHKNTGKQMRLDVTLGAASYCKGKMG